MESQGEMEQKAGFVAVVGRPNSGKSSLLNWLIGEKLALVSHKANATRKRMNFIVMHKNAQIIFVDTPGIHQKERLLNQFMLEEAIKAIGDCDLVLFLASVKDDLKEYEEFLRLNKKNRPHIVLLTKMDLVSKERLLQKLGEYQKFQDRYLEIVPISIKKGTKQSDLLDIVVKYLPNHPYLYDPEMLTTENLKEIYKEYIREAVFNNLSDEIPYLSDVIVERVEELPDMEKIYAKIVTEKRSQKGIIIGKGGSAIKRIGIEARKNIEDLSQKRVFLKLEVVVKPGWSKDKKKLFDIGYRVRT
ncbi:MAG: GTPase Era [Epsilonproteobacteria bacterium]|nr:GTPase Era [Campylobacterota bacterium]